jgi:hypothetical protein
VVLPAQVEDRAVGVQGVQEEAQAQLGKVLVELPGQPREGLQFAVLLGGLGVGVLDELRTDGDRQPVRRDQFGLQDVVVVLGLPAHGPLQAMGAMSAAKEQLPRAVEGHQEVCQQTPTVQDLHANEPVDHAAAKAGRFAGRQAAQEVVQGVAVGHAVLAAAGEAIEVLQGLGAVQFKADLAAGPQFEEEDQQARPHQTPRRIGDPVRVARVAQAVQPGAQVGEEVGDGRGHDPAQF